VALVRTDIPEERGASIIRVLVTANIVPSSPFLVTLMMEVLCFSETPVLTRVTQHNIPEDGILHSSFFVYIKIAGHSTKVLHKSHFHKC
jgi:hypothetical protein